MFKSKKLNCKQAHKSSIICHSMNVRKKKKDLFPKTRWIFENESQPGV